MTPPEHNRIWVLIARKLAGEAGQEELQELRALLEERPELQFAFTLAEAYWNQHPDISPTEPEIDRAMGRILRAAAPETNPVEDVPEWSEEALGTRGGDVRRPRRGIIRRRRFALAVALGMAILAGGLLLIPWKRDRIGTQEATVAPRNNRVETRMGTRSRLILPDGSTVWLNAGSSLTYPSSFSSPNREVNLDGEAFFDVVKDPGHLFIVHTALLDIRVLGTAFNVKAYAQDKETETTLLRGSVEVTRKDEPDAPRIMMKPNEKLIYRAGQELGSPTRPAEAATTNEVELTTLRPHKDPVDLAETAWMYNRLEFHGETFEDLALQLDRWYNVRIEFTSDSVKHYRFTGSFANETIAQALEALKTANRFSYKIENDEIVIMPE